MAFALGRATKKSNLGQLEILEALFWNLDTSKP
jgi:hypothetical protein